MPRHSLASAQISDPASPFTVAILGLPASRGCPSVRLTTSRHSSQKHPALDHCLLLTLGDSPLRLDSDGVPGAWPCPPSRARSLSSQTQVPRAGPAFPSQWAPKGWALSPPSRSHPHTQLSPMWFLSFGAGIWTGWQEKVSKPSPASLRLTRPRPSVGAHRGAGDPF